MAGATGSPDPRPVRTTDKAQRRLPARRTMVDIEVTPIRRFGSSRNRWKADPSCKRKESKSSPGSPQPGPQEFRTVNRGRRVVIADRHHGMPAERTLEPPRQGHNSRLRNGFRLKALVNGEAEDERKPAARQPRSSFKS